MNNKQSPFREYYMSPKFQIKIAGLIFFYLDALRGLRIRTWYSWIRKPFNINSMSA